MRKQHVVPFGCEWAVRADGNTRISATYSNRSEAINAAKKEVGSKSSYVIVHHKNGRINAPNRNERTH